jgi:hypothetical protein
LNSGINDQLNFLEDSKSCFEDSLGYSPRYFRSPTWCGLGFPAVEELVRLGYQVDCSATPQRPGLLSSLPFENPWIFAPRRPYWLRRGLLEIPTSTFLLPLGSAAFAMLRGLGSRILLRFLRMEARKSTGEVLLLSFDIQDFDRCREKISPFFLGDK